MEGTITMPNANKELARRYVEEVFNGNLDAIEDIVHPNFMNHIVKKPPRLSGCYRQTTMASYNDQVFDKVLEG